MGKGTSEGREEREDSPSTAHDLYGVIILSRGLHVKQVKLPRCAGQGNGLSPAPICLHNDHSLPGWASNLLGCLCSSQPFSRGKAWQKTSDEGCLRLGTPIIPLCLSRADICNHLPSCLLSPDGWLAQSLSDGSRYHRIPDNLTTWGTGRTLRVYPQSRASPDSDGGLAL